MDLLKLSFFWIKEISRCLIQNHIKFHFEGVLEKLVIVIKEIVCVGIFIMKLTHFTCIKFGCKIHTAIYANACPNWVHNEYYCLDFFVKKLWSKIFKQKLLCLRCYYLLLVIFVANINIHVLCGSVGYLIFTKLHLVFWNKFCSTKERIINRAETQSTAFSFS